MSNSKKLHEGSAKQISRKGRRKKWTKDDTELTLLSAPTLLWFLIFSYMPMFGIIIAFKNYKLAFRFQNCKNHMGKGKRGKRLRDIQRDEQKREI